MYRKVFYSNNNYINGDDNMKENNELISNIINKTEPKRKIFKNAFQAFFIGGIICLIKLISIEKICLVELI